MEQSIQFFSKKYDELLEKGKGFTNTISVKMKEQYDTEQEISAMKIRLTNMEKSLAKTNKDLDDLGQYLRRDCVEVIGAKATTEQECNKIVMAMAKDMNITVEPNDISISQSLPTAKDKDDKFIVKFTRRETKNKFFGNRQKLAGRKPSSMPSLKNVLQTDNKIFISESLTPLRKKTLWIC